MRCAIWYHMCNFKKVKNTNGGVLTLLHCTIHFITKKSLANVLNEWSPFYSGATLELSWIKKRTRFQKKKVDKKARATPAYHDMKMKRCLSISAVDFNRILSVSVFVFFLLTFGTNILIKKSQSFLFFRSMFSWRC